MFLCVITWRRGGDRYVLADQCLADGLRLGRFRHTKDLCALWRRFPPKLQPDQEQWACPMLWTSPGVNSPWLNPPHSILHPQQIKKGGGENNPVQENIFSPPFLTPNFFSSHRDINQFVFISKERQQFPFLCEQTMSNRIIHFHDYYHNFSRFLPSCMLPSLCWGLSMPRRAGDGPPPPISHRDRRLRGENQLFMCARVFSVCK